MNSLNLHFLRGAALAVVASFGHLVQAAETLTLNGLHTNSNVLWTVNSTTELTGSGAFYGSYSNGSTTAVDPTFCIDLAGLITGFPTSFSVQRQMVYNGAGWLVKTYGQAAKDNAVLASALQFAIWNATYDTDLTVGSGAFLVNSDYGSGAAAQANVYLAAMGSNKAGAYAYVRTGSVGQSQIVAAPAPASVAPFLIGAVGAFRRRKSNRKA